MADLDLKVQLSLQDKATAQLKKFNAELAKTKKQLQSVSKISANMKIGASGGQRPSGGTSASRGNLGGVAAGAGALAGGSAVSAGAIAAGSALSRIISGLGTQLINANQALQKISLTMATVVAGMGQGSSATSTLTKHSKDLGEAYEFLDEHADQLGDRLDRVTKEMNQTSNATNKATKATDKNNKVIKKSIALKLKDKAVTTKNFLTVKRAVPVYLKWGAALGVVAAGLKVISSAIRTGAEYEQLRAQLQGVITDAEDVGEAFEFIKGVSSQLPTTIAQTTAAFIKMRALGIIPTQERMLAFGNIAATFGANILDVAESAARATVFEFERLEAFGIKYKQQGDKVIFTFQNVSEEVDKNTKDIIGYLERLGSGKLAGAAALQMDTLIGKTTNLADAWAELLDTIAQSGLNDWAKSMVIWLTDVVKSLDSVHTFIQIVAVKGIGAFRNFVTTVKHMFAAMWPIIKSGFIDFINYLSEKLKTWINGAANTFNSITELFGLDLKIDYDPVIESKSELDKVTKELAASLQEELAANDAVTQSAIEYWESQLLVTKSTEDYNNQLKELEKSQNAKTKSDLAAKVAQDAYNTALKSGKALTQDVRTNVEVYKDTVLELNKLLKIGVITQETFNRALKVAKDTASGGLFDETRTETENINAYFDDLEVLLNEGIINWDTYGRAVENKLKEIKDAAGETSSEMNEFFLEAARSMENSMSDLFFDVMQGDFDDLAGNFKKTLDRMFADLLASQLANALFGNYGATGSIGGLVGGAGDFQ